MVWEQQVLVVVMTTRVVERGRTKCGQYWEAEEAGVATYGGFRVTTASVEQHADYIVTALHLANLKVEHWIWFLGAGSIKERERHISQN
jgi:tyrosine-protein phosphatase non-receptor type 9